MRWQPENESLLSAAESLVSGRCVVGLIGQGDSGRWRWEVVSFPDDGVMYRDDRFGWLPSKNEAKAEVMRRWSNWLIRAGLTQRGEDA